MGVPIPAAAIIGSAVSTAVNGGTFASFAIGVGIGIAAGYISNAMGVSLFGKTNWETFIKDPIGMFAAGALQGSIAGAISSAVYGQDIWKGMGEGALGGVIGAGVAISTATVLSFGKTVIEEFRLSFVESIGKLAQAIGAAAIKVAGIAINIATATVNTAIALTIFPLQVAGALIADIIYGPIDQMIIKGNDVGMHVYNDMKVKAFRFNERIRFSYAISKDEIHVGDMVFRALEKGESWVVEHIKHEIGHTYQARELGIFYGVTVVPLTIPANVLTQLGIKNTPIHYFEDNATARGQYGGIK